MRILYKILLFLTINGFFFLPINRIKIQNRYEHNVFNFRHVFEKNVLTQLSAKVRAVYAYTGYVLTYKLYRQKPFRGNKKLENILLVNDSLRSSNKKLYIVPLRINSLYVVCTMQLIVALNYVRNIYIFWNDHYVIVYDIINHTIYIYIY